MSFSWADSIVQKITEVKKSHLDELRTNVDHLRVVHLGMSATSWTDPTIVQYQTKIKSIHWQDMHGSLDAAKDANYCGTYSVCPANFSSNQANYVSDNGGNYGNNGNYADYGNNAYYSNCKEG
jgi:hypothetical protein